MYHHYPYHYHHHHLYHDTESDALLLPACLGGLSSVGPSLSIPCSSLSRLSVLYTVHPTLHCTPLFWWPTHLAWTQVHQMMKIATVMNFNHHNIIIMFIMSLPVLIGGGRKRFPVFSVRKFSFASQWLIAMAVTTKQLSFLIISSNISTATEIVWGMNK